jgi:predicted PurR-regulated permease PerM
MGETIPSQTIPKKLVSRNVAIALGIICIILVVGVVGAFAYYMPMINDKNNTISSLNTQISQSTTNNTNLQSWLVGNETLLRDRKSVV